MTKFKMLPIGAIDKYITIEGPVEIRVDYDDVDHKFAKQVAKLIVLLLNERNSQDILKLLE